MSPPSGCPTCWPAANVHRLVQHTEAQIADATAALWPDTEATVGPTVTAGEALLRQVRVGVQTLCATVRLASTALRGVVLGDDGDLSSVLAGDGAGVDMAVQEADQLTALATHSRLRVTTPTATANGVLFTPCLSGPSLASRLREHPADLTGLLTGLLDELDEVHHDPPEQLWQVAAPTGIRAHPRIVDQALARPTDHLHPDPAQHAAAGELRPLLGSLSLRLNGWPPSSTHCCSPAPDSRDLSRYVMIGVDVLVALVFAGWRRWSWRTWRTRAT